MIDKPYSALAEIYEKVLSDEEYSCWAEYLCSLVKSHSNGLSGLDMACGTGYFTRALKRAGFYVEGIDLSSDMLNIALSLARKEGLNVLFREGDMSAVKNFTKVDFITVVNDGINYLSPEKIEKTFKRFYSLLKQDGVLFFDVSTEYKLKNVIANNVFSVDTEDFTYVWFNTQGRDKVDMDISVFIKDGDRYLKKEERQTQYVHKTEDLYKKLEKCGYKTVIVNEHLGGELKPDSLRAQFIAKK